jgi:hypothetical protein
MYLNFSVDNLILNKKYCSFSKEGDYVKLYISEPSVNLLIPNYSCQYLNSLRIKGIYNYFEIK